MAHFDRFDICAAWNLFAHHHNGDRKAAKAFERLGRIDYKCAPREEVISGLSENALEIYAALCAQAGTLERPEHEIANASDRGYDMRDRLFRMWAGSATNSGLLGRKVYVWARSFDDAFEALVEWLDENAPGCLVSHEDAQDALREWCYGAAENGEPIDWRNPPDDVYEQVEQANDWTAIGHTSLKTGNHIRSYEWGGDEVETGCDEYNAVLLASTAAAREQLKAEGKVQS